MKLADNTKKSNKKNNVLRFVFPSYWGNFVIQIKQNPHDNNRLHQ